MDWQTLSEKLKSLGMQLGKEQLLKTAATKNIPIDTILDGTVLETIYGEAFFTSDHFDQNYKHGNIFLKKPQTFDLVAYYAKVPQIDQSQFKNIIFLDTETTGLAGGTGTLAFMIGVGRFTDDGFVINQYFLRQPGEEAAALATLTQFLDPLAAVCTYNGKTFDIPLMNTRYIMQAMKSPFINLPHFDLLALSRRLWRDRLISCTLGNIEREILGVMREEQEVPGYLIPELYTDYLRSGDARSMKGVFYHNAIDILSLAALFVYVAGFLSDPHIYQTVDGIDLASLGRLYKALGHDEHATKVFDESLKRNLPKEIYIKTLMHYANIFKQKKEPAKAVGLWEKAAEEHSIDACVELAKYYEHCSKEYDKAIIWTLQGIALAENEPVLLEALAHRKQRLDRKIEQPNFEK